MIEQKKEEQTQKRDIYDWIVYIIQICTLVFGIIVLLYLIISAKII